MLKEIIILVLAYEGEPWKTIETEGVRKTWGLSQHPNVKIIYYYSNSDKTYLEGNNLFVKGQEGICNIGLKTISAFDFLLENFSFDVLYRTNVSSYIDVELLSEFVESVNTENFFCAPTGHYGPLNLKFASGSGYFLSRDLVARVVHNKDKWNHKLIDDVALSQMLAGENIHPQHGTRFDIINETNPPLDFYHYRCKNTTGHRENDIVRMNKIHGLKTSRKCV